MDNHPEVEGLSLRNYLQSRFRTRAEDWFGWLFRQIRFPAGTRVLDMGAGTGTFWLVNLKAVSPSWQIHLSDLSREMMVTARMSLQKALPNLAYTICDAQCLPYHRGFFRTVMADGLLDQVCDLERVLSEIKRVLAQDGCLYASTGGDAHLKELREMVHAVTGQALYGRSSDRFTLDQGASLLEGRFASVQRIDYEDRLVFRDARPVMVYALSEPPMASILTGDNLVRFSHRIEQRLMEQGQITITSQKGLFRACEPEG